MDNVTITSENETAIFEATVTVHADTQPRMLNTAANYLSSYAADHNKAAAVTRSEVMFRTGTEVTIRFS